MTRTTTLMLCVFALGLVFTPCVKAQADERPNILFILVDDQRNTSLGCAGNEIVKTPTVDRLAEDGIRFENMFVTTSICAASRASIFTGLTERTHGYTFGMPPVCTEDISESFPTLLRENGYRTGFIGKFGVGVEGGKKATDAMFDFYRPLNRAPYFRKNEDGVLQHIATTTGELAIEFIETQPEDQPFCLEMAFNISHAEDGDKRPGVGHYPWPKAVDGMYEDIEMPAPRLGDPKIFESQPEVLQESMNRDRWYWRWDTPEKYQTNLRAYYRMLTGMDRIVGQVIDKLEEEGLADNTVIIYTADNGYYMGDRGFAGKWSHYEQSLRVPLVIFDPRVDKSLAGRVEDKMALNIDLPATMLDLAGVAIPERYQGASLKPIVDGEKPGEWRTDFFCEHLMNNARIPKWEGVRAGRYVYARYFEADYEFLHDLKTDPDQLTNFVDDAEYADVLETMRTRCVELRDGYAAEKRQ